MPGPDSAILLIHCPDQKGLVAAVTSFIAKHQGNIIYLDQHVDPQKKIFFMRVEFDLTAFSVEPEKIKDRFITEVAEPYNMNWGLYFSDETPRMAVFVSKLPHCLFDIIARIESGEWNVELPVIISNHPDLEETARRFGIDYYHLPITKTNKSQQEAQEKEILSRYNIDFIVLARYMQILTEDFVAEYENRIINIHHSFLPAFPGAKPYHSAYERGVKIIGATSHYVTPVLDAGPIIEQDVTRVSHANDIKALVRKGRDLEKVVLSRAVYSHIRRKILVYENRTVVFT
ncbi:MAG: formyltetrahydrofolate deformylase [Candidatus Marinimicrobia bacterium]|nr:formyltetrahydrofolate deformylase [Candidatus Neomarinimicrobiota bacterium]